MNITIARESESIFVVKSDESYWSDGAPISARMAMDIRASGDRFLSSTKAQSIDRRNGNHYIIITPISVSSSTIVASAASLAVGQSITHSV